MEPDRPRPEFVHYYGDWFWHSEELTSWTKSLLLFFDGIALALPSEVADYFINTHPYLAQPLVERGLLRNFDPELWLTEIPHTSLSDLQRAMIEITQWDVASTSAGIIPMSPLLDYQVEFDFLQELHAHLVTFPDILKPDLLREVQPEIDIIKAVRAERASLANFFDLPEEVQPDVAKAARAVRAFLVGATSRMLTQNVKDVNIQPLNYDRNAAKFVASVVGLSAGESRPDVVVGDMARVGLGLTAVPLDEVIDFRRTYGSEYRAYSKEVREFVLSLSLMTENDRIAAIAARRADFDDRAARLRRIGRQSFKRQSIGLALGFTGAAWTLAHGDPWGAAFAAGATAAGISRPSLGSIGAAYTYVFRAADELAR